MAAGVLWDGGWMFLSQDSLQEALEAELRLSNVAARPVMYNI